MQKLIVGILAHVFMRIASIWKVLLILHIACDKTIDVMDIVSTKMTNTVVASTVSINSDSKNVRSKIDCYILHGVLLVIVLLLIVTIICYHYEKHRSKQKSIDALQIQKWKIENFKKFILKNRTCHDIYDIIKLEDFAIDNILIDEKLHLNILIFDVSYKL